MADVSRFVWIDVGMLDDTLRSVRRRHDLLSRLQHLLQEMLPVEEGVDVPGTGHLDANHTVARLEGGDDRFGDGPGCLTRLTREIETDRTGDVSQLRRGRVGERDLIEFHPPLENDTANGNLEGAFGGDG